MAIHGQYRRLSEGRWELRVLPQAWSGELWQTILRAVDRQAPNKHPQTVRLEPAVGNLFLKIFHPPSAIGAVKDFFRASRALRFLRQGLALAAAGFLVPTAIAAGEERRWRCLKRAFVVTLGIPGEPVPLFLRHGCGEAAPALPLAEKRFGLKLLGRELRRLHDAGFVLGDAVPSNIMIVREAGVGIRFYLMDHDRTRRYPRWLAQSLWKRNLVQLNRLPLPGITLQDRMRFFRAYSGRRQGSARERRLLDWLERKTRQRRKECDGIGPGGSFRKLMSWKRETA